MFTSEASAIELMIKQNVKIYIACTGAPFDTPNRMLNVAGTSNIFLGCTIPYNPQAFDEFIEIPMKSGYCSQLGAIRLAQASHRKAMDICFKNGVSTSNCIGIGASAAVATDRTRRGEDALYIAIVKDDLQVATYILNKGVDRRDQAKFCNQVMMSIITRAIFGNDLKSSLHIGPILTDMVVKETDNITESMIGRDRYMFANPKPYSLADHLEDNRMLGDNTLQFDLDLDVPIFINKHGDREYWSDYKDVDNPILFPGSFNPLHVGHINMAKIIEETTGRDVVFEMSLRNVDKECTDLSDALGRATQFLGRWGVVIHANAAMLLQKKIEYGVSDYIVGEDTISRIIDETYYSSNNHMEDDLDMLKEFGMRFFVFRRKETKIPLVKMASMMTIIGEEFDISSSEIRRDE